MIKQFNKGDLKELTVFLSHIENELERIELLSDVIIDSHKVYTIEVYTSETLPYYFQVPAVIIDEYFSEYFDALKSDFDSDELADLKRFLNAEELGAMTINAFLSEWAGDILKLDFYTFLKNRFFTDLLTELN